MTNQVLEYIQNIEEVNRIIQGISRVSGKPKEHIDSLWKDTEKEVLVKHKYGVTDKYKEIGNIVRSKMGMKPDVDEEPKKKEDKDQ